MIINADKLKTMSDEDLKIAYEYFFLFAGMWAVGGPVGGG
jgi:hypothetical protein